MKKQPAPPAATDVDLITELFQPATEQDATARMTTSELWRFLRDYHGKNDITDNEIFVFLKRKLFKKTVVIEDDKAVVKWLLKAK